MGKYDTVFEVLQARHNKMAELTERNPAVTPALRNVAESILRFCEDEGIPPEHLKFRVNMVSGHRIMVNLITPKDAAREMARRMAS